MSKVIYGFWALAALYAAAADSGNVDYTPHGTQPGLEYPLLSADNCAQCHAPPAGDADAEAHYFPHSSWSGSMLANAARDPLFWAALDVANNDLPGVGDFCLRCHLPKAWLEGRVVKTPAGALVDGADGCLVQGNPLSPIEDDGNDFQGITCHFCHRSESTGPLGEVAPLDNANIWVDDQACPGSDEPCRKGPYGYLQADELKPPHAWENDPDLASSAMCGSCHDVSAPRIPGGKTLVLADGTDTGNPFPVERTYSEWLNSDHADLILATPWEPGAPDLSSGQTCQNCHMPLAEDTHARAARQGAPGSRAGQLPVHEFAGGNTWMPAVLDAQYGASLNRSAAFARTVELATTMLRSSAQLTTQATRSEDRLDVAVRVTNLSGHKLPTGYAEGRRMWLNLLVRDASGSVVFESGRYDQQEARLQEDVQLRTYEVVHGEWHDNTCVTSENGLPVFHFVLSNCIARDTRIPPLGFRGGADVELQPVGRDYPETSPGSGRLVNYDHVEYLVPLGTDSTGPFTVTASLYYQTATREYIDFLSREAQNNAMPSENELCDRSVTWGAADRSRGAYMQWLWENNGKSAPVEMTSSEAVVQ